ncbi:MAG: hypothetical protein ACLR9M_13845 [Eggerthella lenta]
MANAAATATSTCSACVPSPSAGASPSSAGLAARMMHAMVTSGSASRNPCAIVSENELTQRNRK